MFIKSCAFVAHNALNALKILASIHRQSLGVSKPLRRRISTSKAGFQGPSDTWGGVAPHHAIPLISAARVRHSLFRFPLLTSSLKHPRKTCYLHEHRRICTGDQSQGLGSIYCSFSVGDYVREQRQHLFRSKYLSPYAGPVDRSRWCAEESAPDLRTLSSGNSDFVRSCQSHIGARPHVRAPPLKKRQRHIQAECRNPVAERRHRSQS